MEGLAVGRAWLSRIWFKAEASRLISYHPPALDIHLPFFPPHKQEDALVSLSLLPLRGREKRVCAALPTSTSLLPLQGDAEFSSEESNQRKTVHVKFTLKKECLFGERFLLVGDDPSVGQWEPANAIPLEWSDGHTWMTELDLPAGKPIQYKFLLCGPSKEIKWQPGPDRVLKTWETTKVIVVSDEWDNAEDVKIIEEEIASTERISGTNESITIDIEREKEIISSHEGPLGDAESALVPCLNIVPDKAEEKIPEIYLQDKLQQEEVQARDEKSYDSESESTPSLFDDAPVQDKVHLLGGSQLVALGNDNSWGGEIFNRFLLALGFSLHGLT